MVVHACYLATREVWVGGSQSGANQSKKNEEMAQMIASTGPEFKLQYQKKKKSLTPFQPTCQVTNL
jgi:hypothetical protein